MIKDYLLYFYQLSFACNVSFHRTTSGSLSQQTQVFIFVRMNERRGVGLPPDPPHYERGKTRVSDTNTYIEQRH